MFFYNENENELNPSNISLRKYSNCTSIEDKIATFLADVLGNKDKIFKAIDEIESNTNYTVLEDFFVKQIPTTTNKNYDVEYNSVVNFIQENFLKDIAFLSQNSDWFNTHIVDLLELYYFDYVSQSCIILGELYNGDPDVRKPLYYSLEWEKTSKDRKCITLSWNYLQKEIQKIYSHIVVLRMINQNDDGDMTDYYGIRKYLYENPEKDVNYANQLKEISNIYINHIHDCGDKLKKIKKMINIQMKLKKN